MILLFTKKRRHRDRSKSEKTFVISIKMKKHKIERDDNDDIPCPFFYPFPTDFVDPYANLEIEILRCYLRTRLSPPCLPKPTISEEKNAAEPRDLGVFLTEAIVRPSTSAFRNLQNALRLEKIRSVIESPSLWEWMVNRLLHICSSHEDSTFVDLPLMISLTLPAKNAFVKPANRREIIDLDPSKQDLELDHIVCREEQRMLPIVDQSIGKDILDHLHKTLSDGVASLDLPEVLPWSLIKPKQTTIHDVSDEFRPSPQNLDDDRLPEVLMLRKIEIAKLDSIASESDRCLQQISISMDVEKTSNDSMPLEKDLQRPIQSIADEILEEASSIETLPISEPFPILIEGGFSSFKELFINDLQSKFELQTLPPLTMDRNEERSDRTITLCESLPSQREAFHLDLYLPWKISEETSFKVPSTLVDKLPISLPFQLNISEVDCVDMAIETSNFVDFRREERLTFPLSLRSQEKSMALSKIEFPPKKQTLTTETGGSDLRYLHRLRKNVQPDVNKEAHSHQTNLILSFPKVLDNPQKKTPNLKDAMERFTIQWTSEFRSLFQICYSCHMNVLNKLPFKIRSHFGRQLFDVASTMTMTRSPIEDENIWRTMEIVSIMREASVHLFDFGILVTEQYLKKVSKSSKHEF